MVGLFVTLRTHLGASDRTGAHPRAPILCAGRVLGRPHSDPNRLGRGPRSATQPDLRRATAARTPAGGPPTPTRLRASVSPAPGCTAPGPRLPGRSNGSPMISRPAGRSTGARCGSPTWWRPPSPTRSTSGNPRFVATRSSEPASSRATAGSPKRSSAGSHSQAALRRGLAALAKVPSERTGRPPAPASPTVYRDLPRTIFHYGCRTEILPPELRPASGLEVPEAAPAAKHRGSLQADDADRPRVLIADWEVPSDLQVLRLEDMWVERARWHPLVAEARG